MALDARRTLLAKMEMTEGTDPVPTAAANAMEVYDVSLTPVAGSSLARTGAFPSFGSLPPAFGNKNVTLKFKVPLAGSGAAGTAPAWGPVMRASGCSETIVAVTSVTYAPISASQESATFYSNEDGTLHALVGARGTAVLTFPGAALPYLDVTMTGRWTTPTAAALAALTLTGWKNPIPVGKINTPLFTLDGFAAVMESFTLDLGNAVTARDRPNAAYVALTNRAVTGALTIEAPPLGNKNFFIMATADPPVPFSTRLTHGTVAGNILDLTAAQTTIQQPGYGAVDGMKTLSGNLFFNRAAGDDEFSLVVK